MPLDPVIFGLPSTNRIIIGENLTKKNASIFKQALSMKKANKIAQAYTENGIVKIKFTKGKNETAHAVRNVTSLETIVLQHQHSVHAPNSTTNAEVQINNNNPSSSSSRDTLAPIGNNNNITGTATTPMDINSGN